MEDVSGVFPDEDHPPLPACCNTGASNRSKTSCEMIKSGRTSDFIVNDRQHTTDTSGPKDDVRPRPVLATFAEPPLNVRLLFSNY